MASLQTYLVIYGMYQTTTLKKMRVLMLLYFLIIVSINLSLTSKIYLDNGYDSALLDVDPLYYFSLSAKYHLGENKKLKVVLDPIIKFGGGVTESPCYDDFSRAFHCGTGMAWSDAQSGGFLKKYDQDQSINISYS